MCPIFVPSSTHARNNKLFQHLGAVINTVTRNCNLQPNRIEPRYRCIVELITCIMYWNTVSSIALFLFSPYHLPLYNVITRFL
jgi:hypothetical protein